MTPTIEDIIFHCAQHFGVTVENIIKRSRKKEISLARHCAVWFIKREYPEISLTGIGKIIGNRDHSTMIHSLDEIQDLLDVDRVFTKKFNDLVVKIDRNNYIKEDASLNDLAYE